jgi:type III restriction enzyme
MALHPDFPKSPYEILNPEIRWFPADEALREKGYAKLLPPLVAQLRIKVKSWRESNYEGASETSKALLKYWFETEHPIKSSDGTTQYFRYYFAQREAIETIIYLHDIVGVKDKFDLMRFDSSGAVSASLFDEEWKRFVVKMATGSGKTKVLSLVLAWSYFHKLYEPDSDLARNFLLITPNIIVLDRLRCDFEGLKIFFEDPIIPDNGFDDKNWKDDFQLTVHLQDEVNVTNKYGNIFLTNIHRVFENRGASPSFSDENTSEYFLGERPVIKTTDSKIDLGDIVRDVDELMVLNDEAHHIHDASLAWFKSIQDIHNRLLQKGSGISLQLDVTATPRHKHGAIFVQTIVDYPLVEAIYQNVVKHPILPDSASRAKLNERKSSVYSERYEDYIHLGFLEWKKAYEEHKKVGKKAVMFLMTDDTKNCDEVADYLENKYPEFKDSVLLIHTKNNGEIAEVSSGKKKGELEALRKEANEIDFNKHKAIVSVLMLKEGWDVKNVTTIVGLRAFGGGSGNDILPEQTLGRGLRRMYPQEDIPECVSIVGTKAFMDFVESIKSEGVELERKEMGERTRPNAPLVVEVDKDNTAKNIEKLDISIPVMSPRIYREYKNISELDIILFKNTPHEIKNFSKEELREIIFRNIVGKGSDYENEVHHKTVLDNDDNIDYQSVVGYFAQVIMKEMRLVSGYDILYPLVKEFIEKKLFVKSVSIDDINILRNLSEPGISKTIIETFKKEINELTVRDKGEAEIKDYIKISKCRPFITKDQKYLIPKKSLFNKIVGDNDLELKFAEFLDSCSDEDIISYIKNYLAVHFRLDYKKSDGDISNYYPDFVVKKSDDEIYIVETKGREDTDVAPKMQRLKEWCKDINQIQKEKKYDFIYVDEEGFEKYKPHSFKDLIRDFRQFKD